MAEGVFTASHLPDVMVGLDSVFNGDRHKQGIIKDVSTLNAILGRQMVNWTPFYEQAGLNVGRSCIGTKIAWLKDCNDTVVDCTTLSDCNITGPQIESDSQLYQPNICFEKTGSVLDKECKDMFTKAQKIGMKMANIMAALDQELQARAITFLLANVQENRYTGTTGTIVSDDGETGEINEATTTWPAEEWTTELIAEFVATAEANDFYNYYLLTGKNFWKESFVAKYKENCCNTDALVTENGPIDIFFDLKNIDQANGGTRTTLLVDAGAYGYFNVTDYANESPMPFVQGGNLNVWRVPSQRLRYNNGGVLTPVYYDFEIQESCMIDDTRNKKYVGTAIKGVHQGGLVLAPPTCNANDTGILSFEVADGGE